MLTSAQPSVNGFECSRYPWVLRKKRIAEKTKEKKKEKSEAGKLKRLAS